MENIAVPRPHGDETDRSSMYMCLLEASKGLTVKQVMSKGVVTITSTDTVQAAARIMSESHLSCLPVVDEGLLKGILTQRDALKEIVEGNGSESARVADRMELDVRTLSPETSILDASRIMDSAGIKWLPVLAGEQLVGVVTQSDATRSITSLVQITKMAAVMNTDVTAVEAATTVLEATRVMLNENISCLVAVHHHKVVGILTEKDIVKRITADGQDARTTLVADIMTFPVVSVSSTDCVFSVCRLMDHRHIHRVLVMNDDKVYGIVTQTDILRALKAALLRAEMVGIDQ